MMESYPGSTRPTPHPPPPPFTSLGALGQSKAEVRGQRNLGKFVFQQNSLQRLLYLHLGEAGYLHDPVGLYTGEQEAGEGGSRGIAACPGQWVSPGRSSRF